MRGPERENITINDWMIPKGEVMLVATTAAHMDEKVWNTRKLSDHPLTRFWSDRFLVYPSESKSISEKETSSQQLPSAATASAPKFSVEGLEGAWIPYGGGFRACPGRHFAKKEILLTIALMVTMFDIEIAGNVTVEIDSRANGLGTQRPKNKIPFKMRRRRTQYHFLPRLSSYNVLSQLWWRR